MRLFGQKKQQAPPPVDPTVVISSIRNNLELLDKREQHLQKKIELAVQEARQKAARKDKNGALFCLKRKKMFENEVTKLQGARITLENQVLSLESATVNIEVFKTVEAGTKAMTAIRGNIDADRVDELMATMEEEKETADQIADAISRPAQDMFDDEELLNELAELEAVDLDEKLLTPGLPAGTTVRPPAATIPSTVFNMPDVPTNRLPAHATPAASMEENEEEASLRELQASMLM